MTLVPVKSANMFKAGTELYDALKKALLEQSEFTYAVVEGKNEVYEVAITMLSMLLADTASAAGVPTDHLLELVTAHMELVEKEKGEGERDQD